MTAEELATQLGARQSNGSWLARCPAHEDHNPSLSISAGKNGGVVVRCHAGCNAADIMRSCGHELADLAPPSTETTTKARIATTYQYRDESGTLLYEVVRMDPKGFRQRRPDGAGGWEWSLNGTPRVLYNLAGVIEAALASQRVFIVEGEKDADALIASGECATTSPQGAGKWSAVEAHAREWLAGCDIIIIADKDQAGVNHARQVAASLRDIAESIIIAEARTGKDAADHLGAGHSPDDFDIIAATDPAQFEPHPVSLERWLTGPVDDADYQPDMSRAPELDRPPENTIVQRIKDEADNEEEDALHPSWEPIDLSIALSGSYEQPMPDYLIRDDGRALLYPGSINGIHGDSGVGKGWIIVYLICECARRLKKVVVLDFEDNEASWTSRLLAAGLTPEQILATLIYIRPEVPFGPRSTAKLCERISELGAAVTIIDSLGEAFATESLDENKDVEVGPWYRRVARPIAETGTALAILDHATKAGDNPLYPSGSKRKRAAITGHSMSAEALQPFVKGMGGKLRLTCAKDRHGNYRKGEVVGDLVMSFSAGGTLSIVLESPSLAQAEGKPRTVKGIVHARAAVTAVKKAGRILKQGEVIGLMDIKGGTDDKKTGIDIAVGVGCLTETGGGPGKPRLFEYVRDWNDDDEK